MVGIAYRLRIMGSLALSLCHLAAGRVDAVCSLKAARAVDIAAAQLLVRERGIAIDLPEAPPFGAAPLDIEGRSRVVAAATPEVARASCSPRFRGDPHRLLGLELRALAQRRLLPAPPAAAALARVLRASTSTRSRSTRPSTGCRARARSRAGCARPLPASSSRSR